jgi:acyl carrier protein
MDRTEIFTAVGDACVELLKADRSSLSEDTRFGDDLDADSLDLVEVVMSLEDRFGIAIPEDDLDGVDTIGQAVDLVQTRLTDEARK